MSLVTECIKENLSVWDLCLETEFLKGLCDGTLSEECFKGYTVDDSLYLREYAKVFAYGILHANSMEEMRVFYSLLSFVNEGEGSTRLYYIDRYGLNDADVYKLPPRDENKAYTDTMLKTAENATSAAECMMAALPCMLSYGYIFKKILNECPQVQNTPYTRFVNDYAGDEYDILCKEWIQATEKACENLTEKEIFNCKEVFSECSKHELAFWQMSAKPRTDI